VEEHQKNYHIGRNKIIWLQNKKKLTWFNEKCTAVIENRNEMKMEVIKDNNNKKRNMPAQKQRG